MQEMCVQSLGVVDPLEEETAPYSCILTWKSPWTEEADGLQRVGLQRLGHDWATEHVISVFVQRLILPPNIVVINSLHSYSNKLKH